MFLTRYLRTASASESLWQILNGCYGYKSLYTDMALVGMVVKDKVIRFFSCETVQTFSGWDFYGAIMTDVSSKPHSYSDVPQVEPQASLWPQFKALVDGSVAVCVYFAVWSVSTDWYSRVFRCQGWLRKRLSTALFLQLLAAAVLRNVLSPKQQRAGHFSCCWPSVCVCVSMPSPRSAHFWLISNVL